jgi:putative peptidoglycan lipid II flippase
VDKKMRDFLHDTFAVSVWSVIGKSAGFLIPFFIAVIFGVTAETDVFFFVYGILLFFTGVFAGTVESVIVPFVSDIRAKDEKDAGPFIVNVLIISFTGLLAVCAFLSGLAVYLTPVITNFSREKLDLFITFLMEIMPLITLITLSSILSGALGSYKIFSFPAVSPAFRSLITLAVIFLFKAKIGIHAVTMGYIAGEFVRLLSLARLAFSRNIFPLKFSFKPDFRIRDFFKVSGFQSVCLASGGLNIMIDKVMASWLEQGSLTILHYADRLYMIPVNIMTAGFFPVALSYWSYSYYKQKRRGELLTKVKNTAGLSLLISFPLFFVFVLLRRPIVDFLFAGSKIPSEYIPALRWTWICYLMGLMPYIAASMFVPAYLTLKKTLVLMNIGLAGCFFNAGLNYVLMGPMGVAGIALSTSAASLLSLTLLLIFSREKRGTPA